MPEVLVKVPAVSVDVDGRKHAVLVLVPTVTVKAVVPAKAVVMTPSAFATIQLAGVVPSVTVTVSDEPVPVFTSV
jgi:hypothetical protein